MSGRDLKQAHAIDYAQIFESPQGQLVLSELIDEFYNTPFVKGGADAARQTDYNCGAFAVMQFILDMTNAAQTQPLATRKRSK
jgi:hypothetical protein